MTKIITKLLIISLLLASMLVLSSCASLGPAYQKVEMIPADVGLVYIYRPSSFVGGGVSYDIKIGETPIVTLYNCGYYPYFSKPGEIEFWAQTESKSSVTLDVKAGQTYYIKGTVGIGIIVGRPHLMVMTQEAAEKEILACKLIPVEEKK